MDWEAEAGLAAGVQAAQGLAEEEETDWVAEEAKD